MSTPICSRCQKIYTAGSAPAKCVNCGGEVRVPGAVNKSATVSSLNDSPLGKRCSVNACNGVVTMAVKYYSDGKKILMAPSPEEKSVDFIELCTKHAQEYKAPDTWTLLHRESLPSRAEFSRESGSKKLTSGGDSGIGDFFVMLFVIVFWIAAIIGGGWLLIEFFGWLSSGSGGDGSNQPFRMPRWRRR